MRKPFAIGAASLAVFLSLGLAACGSDDSGDSGDTAAEPLTKAELVAEADRICTETNDEYTVKVDENLNEESTTEDAVAFITEEAVPLYTEQVEQLQELQPADEVAQEWADVTAAFESDMQDLEADPESVLTEDSAFPEATRLARKFGIGVCGVD